VARLAEHCRLEHSVENPFGGEGDHQAREAAEDHADADQCPDDPDGACGPGTPDENGEDEGDGGVDQKPTGTVARTKLEELDDLDDAFEEKVDGENERKCDQGREGMQNQVDAGEEIDGANDELPDEGAGGVGFEGKDEVGDAAEDHRPAEEKSDHDARDGGDEDGEKSGNDEQDAKGYGPVDGPWSEVRECSGRGAHGVLQTG
jgi:hypothetical protein